MLPYENILAVVAEFILGIFISLQVEILTSKSADESQIMILFTRQMVVYQL